jgi:phage tail sheath gpL-like
MAITFNNIPSSLRIPFVFAEFDNSQATQGPALLSYKEFLVGQRLSTGTWTANTVNRCTSVDQAITGGGRGSLIHRMALARFSNNTETELWIGVLDDNASGVAATGTILVAGPATATGTIALYLGGERVTVGVTSGDAATAIATAINAAINATLDLPVTSTVNTATVTVTFRHKGLAGNSYDIRHSFLSGEALPAGVTLTITAMGGVVAGTLNPVLTTLVSAISDLWLNVWSHPYTDSTSLTAIETDLSSRFGPQRAIDGVAITSTIGNFGAITALGGGRNSQHSSIVVQPGASPLTPPWEFAAAVAAVVSKHGAVDPARPFQTLAVNRIVQTPETDRWDASERNLFLFDGISTSVAVAGGAIQLDRMITTYQTSPSGADDTSYLDVNTPLTLMYYRYSWRVRMQTKFPRHKLADDGTKFGPGQDVMTPQLGKAEAINWFDDMVELGLAENAAQFARDLVVERDVTNRNRLNWLMQPDLINQLIGQATKFQFRI